MELAKPGVSGDGRGAAALQLGAAGNAARVRQLRQGALLGDQQFGLAFDATYGGLSDAAPPALRSLFRRAAIVRLMLAAQLGVGRENVKQFRQAVLLQQQDGLEAPADSQRRAGRNGEWDGR